MTAKISLHRFRDCAALAIIGTDGETVYLDAKAARQLAKDLNRLCRSLESEKFTDSAYRMEAVTARKHGEI